MHTLFYIANIKLQGVSDIHKASGFKTVQLEILLKVLKYLKFCPLKVSQLTSCSCQVDISFLLTS